MILRVVLNPRCPPAGAAGVFAVLLLLTVAVRFPFFFPAVIDWDESTFILIGQSLADGHLPYTQTWDVKPPLGFVFYAALIRLFGHSVMAIRLGGVILVATTAFLVYVIASRTWRSAAAAWAAAVLTVGGMSLLASVQATMLEHVMLVPFTGALAVLLCCRRAAHTWFAAGALLATATLIRFDAAFAAIAVGVFVYADARRHAVSGVRALAAFGGGAAAVVGPTIAIYFAAGEFDTLWTTVVGSPASYAQAQNPPLTTLLRQAHNAFGITPRADGVPWLTGLLWLMAFAGIAMAWLRWRQAAEQERRGVLLISLAATAVAASVVLSGQALELAEKSEKLPLAKPDQADEDALNRIVWHSVKGDAPYPAAYAGAHGKGLKKLRLKLDTNAGDDDDDD
jgi:4-amino-4-deoxy-L-arabinose transferase-like glycosyltransferase